MNVRKRKSEKAKLHKIMLGTTALMLAFSSTALADPIRTASGQTTTNAATTAAPVQIANADVRTSFVDVDPEHWALKYITKLALLDVIEGEGAGKFNPENNVSQQHAIIMAIRMLGLEQEALSSNQAVVIGLDVHDYAEPYIVMALEKGLIQISEEMSTDAKGWGEREASREWIAKLVVRMLGQDEEARQNATESTDFTDNLNISSGFLGYINQAVELELITGFTDGSFLPKGKVTRSQLAAMFSRSEAHADQLSPYVTLGTIEKIDAEQMIVIDRYGHVQTLGLNDQTVYYTHESDQTKLSRSNFQVGQAVYVVARNQQAYYVEKIEAQQVISGIEGRVIHIDTNEFTLTATVNGQTEEYKLSSNVNVLGEDGHGMSLNLITPHSTIFISKPNENDEVELLKVQKLAFNKKSAGTIQKMDHERYTIEILAEDTGKVESYGIPSSVEITKNDIALKGTSDLNEGDEIYFEVEDSEVTVVKVIKSMIEIEEGTLIDFNRSREVVTFTKTGSSQPLAHYLDRNVQIVIEGLDFITDTDLSAGDAIRLQINGKTERVEKIIVLNRNVEKYNRSEVIGFDEEVKALRFMDQNGKLRIFKVSDRTRIRAGEQTVTIDTFQHFFTKGKRVNVVVSGDVMLSVELANSFDGVVSSIDTIQRKVMIVTEDQERLTFSYKNAPAVQKYNATTTINQVRSGDQVRVVLNVDGTEIVQIQMEETVPVSVIATNEIGNQLIVRDRNGIVTSTVITDQIRLIRANGERANLYEITTGQALNVTFVGRDPVVVEIPDVKRGKVTAVNVGQRTITIQDAQGQTHELRLNANYRLLHDSGKNISLSDVKVNDRMEYTQSSSNPETVTIASAADRTFWKYDEQTKEISFKRTSMSDTYIYQLHEHAHIHAGNASIRIDSLKDNDRLSVYYLYGKVFEIEKK